MRGFLRQLAPDLFGPDEISILEDALDDAWRRVEHSKAPWASEDYSEAARTIFANHIITMAKSGERDAKWLSDAAILYLSNKANAHAARRSLVAAVASMERIRFEICANARPLRTLADRTGSVLLCRAAASTLVRSARSGRATDEAPVAGTDF